MSRKLSPAEQYREGDILSNTRLRQIARREHMFPLNLYEVMEMARELLERRAASGYHPRSAEKEMHDSSS